MSPGFRHASHAFSAKRRREGGREEGGMDGWMDGERVGLGGCWWWRGEGEQTPLMVSHSLPSAEHRINAGLLQSHNGKSNSIIPPLFLSLPSLHLLSLSFFFFAHTHTPRPRPLSVPSDGNSNTISSREYRQCLLLH